MPTTETAAVVTAPETKKSTKKVVKKATEASAPTKGTKKVKASSEKKDAKPAPEEKKAPASGGPKLGGSRIPVLQIVKKLGGKGVPMPKIITTGIAEGLGSSSISTSVYQMRAKMVPPLLISDKHGQRGEANEEISLTKEGSAVLAQVEKSK